MLTAQYHRTGAHVTDSNRTVVRLAHFLIAPAERRNAAVRRFRHKWLRQILAEHHRAQVLFIRNRF